MNGEELDKALHDVITTIWKAYRESVTTNDFLPFNDAYKMLAEKYGNDQMVKLFLDAYWFNLIPAADRRIHNACESIK